MTDPAHAIDLRSDTVTLPSAAMRAAMAAAPVGNDEYGEDPTMNRLQERTAALLGKEAALWLPTGTMANQVALRVLTRPGDDVIVSRESHTGWHEAGGPAANSGVQLTEIGAGGVFTREEFLAARRPMGHPMHPPTTLVEIENTHNRAGGIVFPQAEVERICAAAREHGVATYLDGARLWNAAVASGRSVAELAPPVRPGRRRVLQGPRRAGGIASSPGGVTSSSERSDTGGCSAGHAAGRHPRRRRASTRSSTTWSGWPRTTRTRGGSRSGSPQSPRVDARPGRSCTRTSSSSG